MEYTESELEFANTYKNQFESIIDVCVLSIKDDIRKTIKERWLSGKSVEGGNIGEYLWSSYKKLKQSKNPSAGGYVDLTLTGSLGDRIDLVKLSNGDYEIVSDDSKYYIIGTQYGFKEFGLTNDEETHIMRLLVNMVEEKLLNI